MEVGKEFKVEITQLKISKPLLKIVARNVNSQTTEFLQNLKACYNEASRSYDIELGGLYIACISQTQFERCRVLQANEVDKTALVVLIDCGYQATLRYFQLRSANAQNIRSLKPLSKEFVLANVQLIPDSDYSDGISKLHDIIVGKEVVLKVKGKTATSLLVDLLIDGKSLVHELIPHDQELSTILGETSLDSQNAFIADKKSERDRRMDERGFCPRTLVESPEGKRKSSSLSEAPFAPITGTDYDVRITAYEDGPRKFFVQFTSQDNSFQKFQSEMQSYKGNLGNFRNKSKGSKCVVFINGQLHRAEILSNDPNVSEVEVTVRLLETGTKALVPLNSLFAMPAALANVQPFATPYTLAGLEEYDERYSTDSEVSFIFHRLTNNKLLKLRVITNENARSLASCELYHEGLNIADECIKWRPSHLEYPDQLPLIRKSYKVEVCYVDSPKEFYVRIHDKEYSRYSMLEEALNSFTSPQLTNPTVGSPCVVKHITANVRGRILERISSEIFRVEFVDFGFVDVFNPKEIRLIDMDLLKLPPFAYKCCLKEVVNLHVSDTFDRRFRDKVSCIQVYQMQIARTLGDAYIVELEEVRNVGVAEHSGRLDWSEGNSTFRTHFANRRRRECFYDSDGETSDGWTHSVLDVLESSESTLVGPQELSWHEHSAGTGFSEFSLKTPTNRVIDFDENNNWDELDSSSSTKSNQQLSSTASSSGVSSQFQFEARPKKIGVRITAINSPTDFTVQKLENADRYKKLCDEIQKLAKAQQPLTVFAKDSWCLAYDSNERLWRRAMIVADLSVRCLDTGAIFSVKSKSHLKAMSSSMRVKPFFGIRCSLPLRISPQKEPMARQCLIHEKEGSLTCQLIAEVDDVRFVELFNREKNIADCINVKGCAERLVVVPSGYAYISYVYSVSDFVIQMETSTERLKMINQYTDRYVAVEVKQPEVGDLVLAFYPAENAFYRARIVAFERKTFKVYLIDHGHEALVELIGQIDDPIIEDIPPIAHKCTLALPRSNGSIEKKFEEFAAKGKTRVYVRTVKPGEKAAVVDILTEWKENITDWLLESSENS